MKTPWKILIGFAVVVSGLALIGWAAPYYTTLLWWEVRKSLSWTLPLLMLAILFLLVLVIGSVRDGDEPGPGWVALALVVGVVGFVGWCWWSFSYHEYQQAKVYAASVHSVRGGMPTLHQRAPYQVAEAQARPDLGALPGEATDPTYLPAENKFSTLVTRRGTLVGYQAALEQTIPLQGHGTGKTCTFSSRAGARLGGWFSRNLGREISDHRRFVRFSDTDAYAYCQHGVPMVVVPLKKQTGWLIVTEESAGYALYNGRTGAITFGTDGAKVQGPSYPLSLAAQQREATHATGSYADWFFSRVGYDTSSEVNSSNSSEFVLPVKGGDGAYVTPLKARGHATAVSAISTLPAESTGAGLATLSVHELTPTWTSLAAIEQRIKADYQDLPNWQQLSVEEIAPLSGGRWVATIGNSGGQNILYRVQGNGALAGDKATCLYRADGSLIRCGTLADTSGNGVGGQYGGGANATGKVPDRSEQTHRAAAGGTGTAGGRRDSTTAQSR